jgi:hypothetical protein
MNFNFTEKSPLGREEEPDYVLVKFWGATDLKTMDGNIYFKDPFFKRVRIPLQIDSKDPTVKATKAAAAAIEEGGKTIIWIMLVLNLFFG